MEAHPTLDCGLDRVKWPAKPLKNPVKPSNTRYHPRKASEAGKI